MRQGCFTSEMHSHLKVGIQSKVQVRTHLRTGDGTMRSSSLPALTCLACQPDPSPTTPLCPVWHTTVWKTGLGQLHGNSYVCPFTEVLVTSGFVKAGWICGEERQTPGAQNRTQTARTARHRAEQRAQDLLIRNCDASALSGSQSISRTGSPHARSHSLLHGRS